MPLCSDEIYCGENHDYQLCPKASDYYNIYIYMFLWASSSGLRSHLDVAISNFLTVLGEVFFGGSPGEAMGNGV